MPHHVSIIPINLDSHYPPPLADPLANPLAPENETAGTPQKGD